MWKKASTAASSRNASGRRDEHPSDHAPGPIIASAAPDVANMIGIPPRRQKKNPYFNKSDSVPQIGVHKPRRRNAAATCKEHMRKVKTDCWDSLSAQSRNGNRNIAVITRSRRRPLPGQPLGNAEKQTLQNFPFSSDFEHRVFPTSSKDPNRRSPAPPFGGSKFDNSSLQPDHDRMSTVLRGELREYVRNVTLHACFADR